ncbi:lytic transglycosylase domain-containing protein [Agromyces salentinus]|uniref:aggregation-promoting factor C-terminal-like domain-containing protein n=1 Tax=Agromyces salentinus TaxID=269421 RepID=UPI001FE64E0D|nr:lytic transglycosylase domain-containing protein [Agromyces salentinus]
MGRHNGSGRSVETPTTPRPVTTRGPVKQAATVVFAFCAALSFVGVHLVDPSIGATAGPDRPTIDRFGGAEAQAIEVGGDFTIGASKEQYAVEAKPAYVEPASTSASDGWAPPAVTPDPGSAQAYAATAVAARGWAMTEFDCLVALWNKESGWRVNAYNAGSGAYGIPQALPGSKMASAGADWETNAGTQIEWGLGYVQGRYGTPCGAWAHSESVGWY